MAKEVRELVEKARRQGWRAEQLPNGHWKLLAPDGIGIVWLAGTPSDHRWRKNAISRMRRHGFRG
ncbi:MAG: hypothetical protein E6I66_08625 [Chloroflexi bacterium]|nr:MAG: hypothetical protein E6I66_08625 [Chloroflexota bacterium]